MFICEQCKSVTKSGEKANKVITETRRKTYKNEKNQIIGEGYETVSEVLQCNKCLGEISATV